MENTAYRLILPGLLSYIYYSVQDHLSKDDISHSDLSSPVARNSQANASKTHPQDPQAHLMEAVP